MNKANEPLPHLIGSDLAGAMQVIARLPDRGATASALKRGSEVEGALSTSRFGRKRRAAAIGGAGRGMAVNGFEGDIWWLFSSWGLTGNLLGEVVADWVVCVLRAGLFVEDSMQLTGRWTGTFSRTTVQSWSIIHRNIQRVSPPDLHRHFASSSRTTVETIPSPTTISCKKAVAR